MTSSLVLICRFDNGEVLPQLRVGTGKLPPEDLKLIDSWLCENYRDLAANRNKIVEVPRILSALPNPASFLIETVVENEPRNPTLRLTYQPPAKPRKSDLPIWAQDLLLTLERQFLKVPENALTVPTQRRIAKALVELQFAARQDPNGTAQNLLQGFILMRRRHLRERFASRRRKLQRMALSLRKLHDAVPSQPSSPTPTSESAPEKKWSFRLW